MPNSSQLVSRFPNGVVLDVLADDLPVRAYVAISPPDLEAVTAFVPPEQFEHGANLHVVAIGAPEEAAAALEDVLFNMDADDAVALLCADLDSWAAALRELGHDDAATSLK
ncbi:MAG TPA: hypothetical protein VKZ52_11890 [Burkholderiaceae bacterium]|nr:hypothetical protein [Burkholderiaceae bacterium]